MAKSFLNNKDYPRGIRNNNPGNIILTNENWQGKISNSQNTDGKFEQFTEIRYGIRAMMRNIISKVNKGNNTVTGLISVLSPAFENDTAGYIATVANTLGISPTIAIELSQESLIALCKIIAAVENGNEYAALITESDYQDAIAILGISLKKKTTTKG
ncbi:hypothetical protein GN157_05555 [Flavobacterium rakeshii]|uniref:Structural protein P5 n=1 Tax=Flavobacterium rakeshii TaxID=1038845 RepID=A0A6N8HBC6_9FLAO|nr:hypothetical protein [Flavobacterium rakeshii]MUV03170.1 hypothetical protein [Flavobacterium rakeshii]